MSHYCAVAYPKETGGILIGHYSADLRVAHVTSLSSAPSDSVAKRFSFARGVRGLQELLQRVWRQKNYYLGEWHFHPDAEPSPSGIDSDQMQSIASAISYQCPEPVLLIVGGHPPSLLQFHSYVFRRGAKEAISLQL
jgi:integrative and conjugative element protein (TIGR02256 family)